VPLSARVRRPALRHRPSLPHRNRRRPEATSAGRAPAVGVRSTTGVVCPAERWVGRRPGRRSQRPASAARRLLRSGVADRLRRVRAGGLGSPAAAASTGAQRGAGSRRTTDRRPQQPATADDAACYDRRRVPAAADDHLNNDESRPVKVRRGVRLRYVRTTGEEPATGTSSSSQRRRSTTSSRRSCCRRTLPLQGTLLRPLQC